MSEPAPRSTALGGVDPASRTERFANLGALASLLLLFLAVTVQKVWSSDTWWQLAVGRWIVEHRAVTQVDEFSFTAAGNPEIEMRWIWCVLIYLGWQVGPWLLVLGQVVILGVAWGLVAASGAKAVRRPEGMMLIALGLCAGQNRWVMRPELVTYAMIAAYLVLLTGGRRGGRGVWAVPALQALWTNTHTLFIMGPVLCWTFAGGDAVMRLLRPRDGRRSIRSLNWTLVGVAALSIAACLVNPYGVRGAFFTGEIWSQSSGDSVVAQTIGEMQSPLSIPLRGWTWDLWCGVLVALVGTWSFLRNWRTVDLVRLAVFLGGLYLACKAQRGLGMFAIMGTWATLQNWSEKPPLANARVARAPWLPAAAYGLLGVTSLGAAWYVASDSSAIRVSAPRETGFGVVSWNTPEGATKFLLESGAQPQVFNQMRDGGYLIWRSEGKLRVFVDGRTDVYGETILRELELAAPETWDQFVDKWNINTAIIPIKGYPNLIRGVHGRANWALVYLDHRNVVFVRDTPEHAALIAKHRIDLSKPWQPPGPEPDQRPEGWKEVIGGRGRPWYTQGVASAFMTLGSLPNAAAYLERTLAEFPGHKGARADLAAILRYYGKTWEGDRLASGLPGDWLAYSDDMLARWLIDAKRHAEAITVLKRLVDLPDSDLSVRVALADEYFQISDFANAKREYERAVQRGHDTAPEWLKLAASYERTGDGRNAIRAYERTLALDPSQYQIWNVLAKLLAQSGDMRGAERALERALQVKPDYEAAKKNLESIRATRRP